MNITTVLRLLMGGIALRLFITKPWEPMACKVTSKPKGVEFNGELLTTHKVTDSTKETTH